MEAKLRGREIVFSEVPERSETRGLVLNFSPSKHWLKQNPHILPVSYANIIAGQQRYKLPRYLPLKAIDYLSFKDGNKYKCFYKKSAPKEKETPPSEE